MARDGQSGRLGRWLTRLTGSMEMPQEVLLDVPRVTMIGRLQVQIENHRGVLEYTPGRIRIRTRDGVLVIVGSRLKIGSIFREEVTIDGAVDRIEVERQEAAGKRGASPS